jgi:hypothetical protein
MVLPNTSRQGGKENLKTIIVCSLSATTASLCLLTTQRKWAAAPQGNEGSEEHLNLCLDLSNSSLKH